MVHKQTVLSFQCGLKRPFSAERNCQINNCGRINEAARSVDKSLNKTSKREWTCEARVRMIKTRRKALFKGGKKRKINSE